MIDRLVLRCPFIKDYQTVFSVSGIPIVRETGRPFLKLPDLKIPLYAALDSDGEQIDLIHKWESIPSSYGSMAFKVFDFRDSFGDEDRQSFYIELNASPAKIMQGHNLYGTDALWPCAEAMIHLLINKYPYLTNYLDQAHWSVEQVDLTYHSWCQTENEAIQLVNALQNVSNGQTRGRTGFAGTAYFGKQNSRIKNIKVYVKLLEVINFIKKEKKAGDKKGTLKYYTSELLDWIKGAVRWEVTLKKRWFERRNINNNLFALNKVFDARILVSLGIGIVSYTGFTALATALITAIKTNYELIDSVVLSLLNLAKVGKALGILFAAFTVRASILAIKKFQPL